MIRQMNMTKYEIVNRDNGETLDSYPTYIQDMIRDIFNFDNRFIYEIIEADNILATLEDRGNSTNKFAIDHISKELDENIAEDSLCLICLKKSVLKNGLSIERQYEILNMLGFVGLNLRFGLKNLLPMVYIRNNAGEEYYNTARFIVFDFLENYDKIGGKNEISN